MPGPVPGPPGAPPGPPGMMQQMGEIVLLTAKLVLEAMPLLQSIGKNAARLNNLTEGIIKLEERADQIDEGPRVRQGLSLRP